MSAHLPEPAADLPADEVVVRVPNPERRLRAVRLAQELWRPRLGPELVRREGGFEIRFRRPPVDRLEYQLELTYADGRTELVCDPANPLRADGPFGPKSVLELPGYRRPAWLDTDAPPGRTRSVRLPARVLGAPRSVAVWSPHRTRSDRRLPLLLVHDGPEYAAFSALLRFLAAAQEAGELPPFRAALVPPVERDRSYSASARYARALVHEVLPRLAAAAPTPAGAEHRAGMGASLGALALLDAHRRYRGTFGGLFLQSGSFFRQRYDRQEMTFPHFARISRFVGGVLAGPGGGDAVPVTMTCGTVEENLANNRAVAAALAGQGYDVRFHEVRDGHNWVAWRDAFEPHLRTFLQRLWG